MSRRLYFDLEGNGLLDALHTLHCGAITDLDSGEEFYYGPAIPIDFDWQGKDPSPEEKHLLANPTGTVADCVQALQEAGLTVAHNGIGYDYLAIEKLFPEFKRCPKAWDSIVAAKMVWPADALADPDFARAKAGKMPMSLVKRHSLKAWGYRLGEYKEEYGGDLRIADPIRRKEVMWEEWNPWMSSYMMQDNRPGVKLWHLIEKRVGWTDPQSASLVWPVSVFEVEHEVARILADQEADGVRFDLDAANKLSAELSNERARIEKELVETFGSWWAAGPMQTASRDVSYKRPEFPDITRRRFGKNGKELKPYVGPPMEHHFEGNTSTPIVRTTFNPSSRDHLGQRLQAVFGWVPKKFGANGKPTVDESVLEEIPEAVIPPTTRKLILDYFVVNKTLGMVAKGSKAWLHLANKNTGRLHGRVDSLGTVTGRGAHSNPNLGQCPAVRKKKVKQPDGSTKEEVLFGLEGRYGAECRALFTADEGWEQTGVDASALELIDLGHYLRPFDDGKFSDRVCDPKRDPHTEHAELTGLTRGDTKTATYLYVYGGSAYKLSLSLSVEPSEVPELLTYKGLPQLLKNLSKRFEQDSEFVAKMDDNQRAKLAKARKIILAFEGGIDGIKDLKDGVTDAAKRGWLKGMDGRRLHVRAAHAALNTLLQSAGAQSCKLWMVLTHRKLNALGLKRGVDFKQILWVHDELQFTHRPGLGPTIKAVAEEAMREAGEMLGLRGVYRTDGKTGKNWFECH